jgi:hypothetical protein
MTLTASPTHRTPTAPRKDPSTVGQPELRQITWTGHSCWAGADAPVGAEARP